MKKERLLSWMTHKGTMSLAMLAVSCSMIGGTSYAVPISPNARLYTYLVVTGMARGAIMTGKMNERNALPLMNVDEKTRLVLEKGLKSPSMRNDIQTDRALEHFLSLIPQ